MIALTSMAMFEQKSWNIVEDALQRTNPPPWKYTMRGNLEEEGLSSACLGMNILTQVLFDWFRGMSLERTGVG